MPGSLTDDHHRHPTHQLLVHKAVEQLHGPQPDKTEKFWTKVAENARKDELAQDTNMQCNTKSNTLKLPQVNVAQHFNFAKKMHVGNLEHQPLPDTLGYRNLHKIGEHRDSDIVVKPYAIGWKGYGASGPTCCTKMRVHRPKTCDAAKPEGEMDEKIRPSTSIPSLGGQYKKSLSLMDLAICWDFRPDNPKVEPKPTKHIDGSNGSKAPAVFTMVHTPKGEVLEQARFAHSNPIFTQNEINNDSGRHLIPYFEKDLSKEKRRDSCDVQYCSQHTNVNDKIKQRNKNGAKPSKAACDGIHGRGTPSESSRGSNPKPLRSDNLQAVKHAWKEINKKSNNKIRNSIDSYENTPLARGKLLQSSPNDSSKDSTSSNNNNGKHKSCFSCNGSHSKSPDEMPRKEDYKFAFKAGNPNSVQGSSTTLDSKGIKIPKMRHPYSKKSYTIPTLAPPFSIWKDADASGYTEHWRLASVYQHAYKPPEQRRKPLISSVFQ